MLRLTLLFTDDVANVFELNTIDGKQRFSLLQEAYSESRYNASFNPEAKTTLEIMRSVKSLLEIAEGIHKAFIKSIK